jgi:osmotically-inducible protein OsmY
MSTRYGDRGSDRYEDEERYGERESARTEGRGYSEYDPRYARGYDYDPISRSRREPRDYDETGRDSPREYGMDDTYSSRGYRSRGPRYGRERLYGEPSERDYNYGGGYGRDYTREYGRGAGREGEPVHSYETDYGRTTSRFYGRSGYDYGREDYDRQNFGSARSDYGDRDYGGRLDERGMGRESRFRNWWDRAADEVLSWFGDEGAGRRRRVYGEREVRGQGTGKFRGRGPKSYRRSDERIHEEINDRLTENEWLDASDVDVSVNSGVVILSGMVDSRYAKRLAEDIADSVSGVVNVQNNLRVANIETPAATGLAEATTDSSSALTPASGATETNRASRAAGKS